MRSIWGLLGEEMRGGFCPVETGPGGEQANRDTLNATYRNGSLPQIEWRGIGSKSDQMLQ